MRRFLCGTPADRRDAGAAGHARAGRGGRHGRHPRAKSVALTAYAVELADELLAPLGVSLASPRDPDRRGGHVTLNHPPMRAVTAALWQRDVIPDYRDPGGLRIGLSPLSTFRRGAGGLAAVRDVLVADS